jgi:hypothetical protein
VRLTPCGGNLLRAELLDRPSWTQPRSADRTGLLVCTARSAPSPSVDQGIGRAAPLNQAVASMPSHPAAPGC